MVWWKDHFLPFLRSSAQSWLSRSELAQWKTRLLSLELPLSQRPLDRPEGCFCRLCLQMYSLLWARAPSTGTAATVHVAYLCSAWAMPDRKSQGIRGALLGNHFPINSSLHQHHMVLTCVHNYLHDTLQKFEPLYPFQCSSEPVFIHI